MKEIINYSILVTAYTSVFYLLYLLFLSRDTFYSRNRIYLLTTLLAATILPAIKFTIPATSELGAISNGFTSVIRLGQVNVTAISGRQDAGQGISALLIIYLAGFTSSLAILILNVSTLRRLIKKSGDPGSRVIFTSGRNISGFSAMGYTFLGNHIEGNDLKVITEHEKKHIEYKHFYDLVLVKIVSAIFWFNPFVYLYERSLRAVHEFQVDESLLKNGETLNSYRQLILNQLFRTTRFSFQSAFAGNTLIKKRIIMMTKKRSGKIAELKMLLVLPVITVLFILFSCSGKEPGVLNTVDEQNPETTEMAIPGEPEQAQLQEIKEDSVWIVVHEMPRFEGGDINKFRNWVQMNVKYPEIAASNGIQGKVYIAFVVTTEGIVKDIEILKGVDPSLDNEVLRTVSSSPAWLPGRHDGKNVNVKMSISVNFQLQ